MRRARHLILFGSVCGLALLPGSAGAQVRCTEGKTATGECVDASLAGALRETANIFAQPKISFTAYPVLPTDDRDYRYPNQLIPDPNQATAHKPPGG